QHRDQLSRHSTSEGTGTSHPRIVSGDARSRRLDPGALQHVESQDPLETGSHVEVSNPLQRSFQAVLPIFVSFLRVGNPLRQLQPLVRSQTVAQERRYVRPSWPRSGIRISQVRI